ncbi:MAG: hypothetical protein ACJ0GV_03745 [Dehalococcoidia bacterium]
MDFNIKSIKELLRDKSRDNFYKNLLDIGIDCTLAKRGINEEKLFNPWHRRSLGIININDNSPIKYINIIKQDRGKNNPPRWWYFFAIPSYDEINKEDNIEVKSKRIKSTPVIGKVESIKWESNANSKKISDIFSEDEEINYLSVDLGNIKVQSLHDNFSGFSIELEFKRRNKNINKKNWESLNKIANLCINHKA